MLWLSYLKERMLMNFFNLASIAEDKVSAYAALVANSLDRANSTSITGNSIVNLRSLLSSSLTKMINHQSLESLSGIGLDFLLDNFDKICIELTLESTRAIASSARHALLIDFRSITLEANDSFVI